MLCIFGFYLLYVICATDFGISSNNVSKTLSSKFWGIEKKRNSFESNFGKKQSQLDFKVYFWRRKKRWVIYSESTRPVLWRVSWFKSSYIACWVKIVLRPRHLIVFRHTRDNKSKQNPVLECWGVPWEKIHNYFNFIYART